MARLGLEFEGHVLVVLGNYFAPKPPGFLRDALSPLLVCQPLLVLFLAVPPEPDLPHDAFKQLFHIVLHSCRRLDELAVKHDGAGSSLCKIARWTCHEASRAGERQSGLRLPRARELAPPGEFLKPNIGTDKSLITRCRLLAYDSSALCHTPCPARGGSPVPAISCERSWGWLTHNETMKAER